MFTHQTQPQNHTTPKQHIVQQRALPDPRQPLHHNNRHLHHHHKKPIPPKLPRNTPHNQLMRQRTNHKRRHGRKRPAHSRARRRVHVTAEEMVHGDIPLARELEPVEAVPPVGVEAAVGEARDFGESAEDVFEDYEEDEQEGDHEGEEQVAYGFGEDEAAIDVGEVWRLQADGGVV